MPQPAGASSWNLGQAFMTHTDREKSSLLSLQCRARSYEEGKRHASSLSDKYDGSYGQEERSAQHTQHVRYEQNCGEEKRDTIPFPAIN